MLSSIIDGHAEQQMFLVVIDKAVVMRIECIHNAYTWLVWCPEVKAALPV